MTLPHQWRALESELINILQRLGAPLDNFDGEPWIVHYDTAGNSYGAVSITDLAKALDERGITCKVLT